MSKALTYTLKANQAVQKNPVAAAKSLIFILLAIVLIFAVFLFLKKLKKGSDLISELGPSTESEKLDAVTKTSYSDALKWLDQTTGAVAIGKSSYKTIDSYLSARKITWSVINKAADAIWNAKLPAYISETEVYNAFASMPSKAAISLMALSFNAKYGKLWNGGPLNVWLPKYFKLAEMKTLTSIIDKKPEL